MLYSEASADCRECGRRACRRSNVVTLVMVGLMAAWLAVAGLPFLAYLTNPPNENLDVFAREAREARGEKPRVGHDPIILAITAAIVVLPLACFAGGAYLAHRQARWLCRRCGQPVRPD